MKFDLQAWTVGVSILLPALISIIVKPEWPNGFKVATAFGLCFVVAFIQSYITGLCNFNDLPKTFLEVFMITMTTYAVFWRGLTGLSQKIETKVNG